MHYCKSTHVILSVNSSYAWFKQIQRLFLEPNVSLIQNLSMLKLKHWEANPDVLEIFRTFCLGNCCCSSPKKQSWLKGNKWKMVKLVFLWGKVNLFLPRIHGYIEKIDQSQSVEVLSLTYDISIATYCKRRQPSQSMDASESKRIKQFEAENSKLNRMYANLIFELETTKYIIEKTLKPCQKREDIDSIRQDRPKDIS